VAGLAGKLVKGCLMAVAGVSLFIALLFAAYVGWGVYANHRAQRQADAFCEAVRRGDDIMKVEARAKGEDGPRRSGHTSEGVYHYYWYGMIFNSQECEVSTVAGRVSATRRLVQDD